YTTLGFALLKILVTVVVFYHLLHNIKRDGRRRHNFEVLYILCVILNVWIYKINELKTQ
ncbi:hypothetical protein ACJX0J_030307, partial [Zea mays]